MYTYGVLTVCSTPNSDGFFSNFLDPVEGGTCIVSDKASILSRKLSTLKE